MSSYCVSSFNRNWTTFVALVLLLLSFINSILAYDSSYYDEEELVEVTQLVNMNTLENLETCLFVLVQRNGETFGDKGFHEI